MNARLHEIGVARAAPFAVALALGLHVLALAFPERFASEQRRDLDAIARTWSGSARESTFALGSVVRFPAHAVVVEDGTPLPLAVSPEAVAKARCGFALENRTVVWAGTEGRRHEVVWAPDYPDVALSWPFLGLSVLALGLGLLGVRSGTIAPRERSSAGAQALLVLGVTVALSLGVARHWDRVFVGVDSAGYLGHSPIRPCLYPAFVDAFDRSPREPREVTPAWTEPRDEPANRFVNVCRAQKVLAIVALALLAAALARQVSVWLVAGLFFWAALVDLERLGGDSTVHWNLDAVMSEGLNHPLVFFLLAALFEHLARPRPVVAAALGLTLGLLLLNRPANGALLALLPLVLVADVPRQGWKKAARSVLPAIAALTLALLAGCAVQARAHGRFRLHAFTGPSLFSVAFQTAEREDVNALHDSRERAFLAACLKSPVARASDFHEGKGDYLNRNLYEIGVPAYERAVPPAARDDAFERDDVMAAVARRLILRHPGAFAAIVLWNLEKLVLAPPIALSLAVLAVALVAFAKTRTTLRLEAVIFAALPVGYMLPACLANYPSERYLSQIYFAAHGALPLLAAALATRPERAE